jgi:hypothetical protein
MAHQVTWFDSKTGTFFKLKHGHYLHDAPSRLVELVKWADHQICSKCKGLGSIGREVDGVKYCDGPCVCTKRAKKNWKATIAELAAQSVVSEDPIPVHPISATEPPPAPIRRAIGRFINAPGAGDYFQIIGRGVPPQEGSDVLIETQAGKLKAVTVGKLLWIGEKCWGQEEELYNWKAGIFGEEKPERPRRWCDMCGEYVFSGTYCSLGSGIPSHMFV